MNVDQESKPSRATARERTGTRRASGLRRAGVVAIIAAALAVGWLVLRPHPATQPAGKAGGGRFGGGPMPVVAATVQKGDLDISLNALGTVTPLATVTVKTQIAGQLTGVGFQEGQMVHAGDFLAQIDPRPYQRQLDQYQGQLLRDQALLKEAQLNLARYRTLVAQDSIAKQQLDTQESLVQQYQGTIATDQALIDTAKLNLAYCHIVAPVSGRVGLRQVDPGNYVQTSDANGIVVITQLQPISVIFTLAEDDLPPVLKQLRASATLKVSAFDRTDRANLATGTLATVDNVIDTSTGTVKLRASFANEEGSLFPNQFVNVRLSVETLRGVTEMPTAAIQRGAPGTFVYLIKADNTVTVRPIKLGPVSGDKVAVNEGLEPGDQVVVDGADKLREGAKVTLPEAEAKPSDNGQKPAEGKEPAKKGERKHARP